MYEIEEMDDQESYEIIRDEAQRHTHMYIYRISKERISNALVNGKSKVIPIHEKNNKIKKQRIKKRKRRRKCPRMKKPMDMILWPFFTSY